MGTNAASNAAAIEDAGAKLEHEPWKFQPDTIGARQSAEISRDEFSMSSDTSASSRHLHFRNQMNGVRLCPAAGSLPLPGTIKMPSTYEPSVEELREELERSREALAATVGELREKVGDTTAELKTLVSPAHIKQEIKNYVREERESLIQAVQRKAKDNPLQMAAVGAALAYPALGLLRAIPTPLMLIGAGLFLTSRRGQQTAKDAKAKFDDAVHQGTEKVSDLADSIKSDLEDRLAGARYGVEQARDSVAAGVGTVTDKARAAFRGGADAANAAKSSVANAATDAVGAMTATAENITAAASGTAGNLKDRASAMGTRSRNSVADFVNDNPLLVAGIAATVGAFIAASIPASEAENRVFGSGSDALKGKAREAAAQGVERAGEIVAGAAGSVAAAAAREGLDAAGVQRALNGVADSVRAVADRGLDTALGGTPQAGQNQNNQRTAS